MICSIKYLISTCSSSVDVFGRFLYNLSPMRSLPSLNNLYQLKTLAFDKLGKFEMKSLIHICTEYFIVRHHSNSNSIKFPNMLVRFNLLKFQKN